MRFSLFLLLLVALTGCQNARTLASSDGGGAVPVNTSQLPQGVDLAVRMDQSVSTSTARVGDTFTASVSEDLVARRGGVAIPAGSTVYGTVTGVSPSSNATESAALRIDFDRIRVNGRTSDFAADVVSADTDRDSDRSLGRDAARGAAAGALIGLIVGGDLKDAVRGAALGAGAGTVISFATSNADAVLDAGSRLTLRTSQRIDLR